MNKCWKRLNELADEIGIQETLEILERGHGLPAAAESQARPFMLARFPTEEISGDQKRADEWHTRLGLLLDFENFIKENAKR